VHTEVAIADNSIEAIATWLREYVANLLELSPQEVSDQQSFARFGLDSAASIAMVGDMCEWVGCEIDISLVYDYPTIEALSRMLASRPDIQRSLQSKGSWQVAG
jgi:acyl carrier protein